MKTLLYLTASFQFRTRLFRKRTPSPMEVGRVIMGKCDLKGSRSSSTAQYASVSSATAFFLSAKGRFRDKRL